MSIKSSRTKTSYKSKQSTHKEQSVYNPHTNHANHAQLLEEIQNMNLNDELNDHEVNKT